MTFGMTTRTLPAEHGVDETGLAHEHARQTQLMHALQQRHTAPLHTLLAARRHLSAARGLAVYVANAGQHAQRALAARYPTVQALMGEQNFGLLARHHWRQHPPQRGDLAQWGDGLADALAQDEQLQEEPYLADVARLDAAVAQAEGAADVAPDLGSLMRLGDTDADQLALLAAPGVAVLHSRFPVVSIWLAHQPPSQAPGESPEADPFAQARQALAAQRGEIALVWRQGWRVRVVAISAAEAVLAQAVLCDGVDLSRCLACSPEVAFDGWLAAAVAQGWVLGARVLAPVP